MKTRWMKVVFIALAVCALQTQANATSGGVDAQGCHGSSKVGKHCHPERARYGGTLPGGETHAQRERRLKRECKGRPNAGACLGFGQ